MDRNERKKLLRDIKRIVVKVGSGVLTRRHGLNLNVIDDLASDICALKKKGIEVVLVSSGAVAGGMRKIGRSRRPDSVSQMQALAALGQSRLIMAYEEAFARYGENVAQVLLTRDDLSNRRRYLNARNTLFTLLSWKVLPIINENDTVVVDELKFGDNDNLSAMVTNLSESGLLINLTNIEGLFDKDPSKNPDAQLIHKIDRIDRKITGFASAIPGFLGTGGMASKISAAHKVALAGVPTIIANGLVPGILRSIFAGKPVGTVVLPESESLCCKKHWIAFTKSPKGTLIIDTGAERALLRNGKSLLPSGIKDVEGRFSIGDAVAIVSNSGRELAVGMVNYRSTAIKKIMGVKSSEIEAILGYKHDDEVVHRDNMVLASQLEQ
jgi:glutamate 5-kinase